MTEQQQQATLGNQVSGDRRSQANSRARVRIRNAARRREKEGAAFGSGDHGDDHTTRDNNTQHSLIYLFPTVETKRTVNVNLKCQGVRFHCTRLEESGGCPGDERICLKISSKSFASAQNSENLFI